MGSMLKFNTWYVSCFWLVSRKNGHDQYLKALSKMHLFPLWIDFLILVLLSPAVWSGQWSVVWTVPSHSQCCPGPLQPPALVPHHSPDRWYAYKTFALFEPPMTFCNRMECKPSLWLRKTPWAGLSQPHPSTAFCSYYSYCLRNSTALSWK